MKIVTKHNRAKVTIGLDPYPGAPFAESQITGVLLEILTGDSDDDDMYAYVWLNKKEAERLAYGLLQMQDKQYIPAH